VQIIQNHPLTKLNTFGIKALAENYVEVHSTESLQEILDLPTYRNSPLLILGGGSNILFTKELIPGLVLKNCIQGIELVKEDSEQVYIRSGAGVNWHQFVMHCIQHKYAGAENLSLIPGNVGAGPMQNIGAYGVELKDIFYELQALNIHTNKIEHFSNADCAFGYRESVFKRTLKDQYVITSVTFCLNKTPRFNTRYGALNAEL
jgi:UDP-N-acetylmuramate dehydrogenase